MPLPDGAFAYGVMQKGEFGHLWVFRFVTKSPACGKGFFNLQDILLPASVYDLPAFVVDCGKVSAEALASLPEPNFYVKREPWEGCINEDEPMLAGINYVYVNRRIPGSLFSKKERVTIDAAIAEGLFYDDMITHLSYERLFQEWRPQMEVREVPEEFLDREAMRKMAAGEPVMEKPLPKQEVELVIILPMQGDDPALDEPEEQFEEPLSEALEEAGCGSCTSSGTTPDSFDIDVDTVKPSLRRCLSVIRRVLTKAGAPAATIIRQLPDDPNDPPIDHPLEAPPAAPKKAAKK
jgi:hypothetical protein